VDIGTSWLVKCLILILEISCGRSVSVSMYNTDNTKGGLLPRAPEGLGTISYGQLEVFFKSPPVHV
jgi:hypothetical protein